MKEYKVEVVTKPCEHCRNGGAWDVVGPDGYAIGITYLDLEDAEEMAEILTHAFILGQELKKEA